MTFGVTPAGFNRKPLAEILTEIEAAAVETFGPLVVQTSVSPLGQLNGMLADIIATEWEFAEDIYQSFDPDQAEGVRLDTLARFRILTRAADENDLILRQAITNADRARIDLTDLSTALLGIAGVTWARVYVNDTDTTDADGIPRQHVAVAVLGGDDEEVAQVTRRYVVPGIGTYGNTTVTTTIDGFCRNIKIIRPVLVPVELEIDIIPRPDKNGCPPPSALAMAAGLFEALIGDDRPASGQDGTEYLFRRIMETRYPNVEVVEVRIAAVPGTPDAPPLVVPFFSMMSFSLEKITVAVTS